MATKGKGKSVILDSQITFSFFDEVKIEKPIKQKKKKAEADNKVTEAKQTNIHKTTFRKAKCNIKPRHKKLNRKVRKIF